MDLWEFFEPLRGCERGDNRSFLGFSESAGLQGGRGDVDGKSAVPGGRGGRRRPVFGGCGKGDEARAHGAG